MTPAMSAALALHQPQTNLGPNPSPEVVAAARRANQLRASLTSDNWPKMIAAFRDLYALSKFDNPKIGRLAQLREMLHRGLFAEEVAETLFPGDGNAQRRKDFVHLARDTTKDAYRPEDVEFEYVDDLGLEILAETVDGILDTVVVGLGWLCELGLSHDQTNILMGEVHASNMTKVDNTGQPVYDSNGKVLKGDNYVKADIVGLLRQFIAQAAPQEGNV